MSESLPRQVIREHRFEKDLRILVSGGREGDAYTEAAEYLLARNPLIGTETVEPDVWALPMAPVEGENIVLYYTFDEERVWFLALRSF